MKASCQTIQSELSAYIDNELPPAKRLAAEAHLGGCPHCRTELEKLRALAAGVGALPKLQPAPQFLVEVHRRIARGEKLQWEVWRDYLFRPFWLKVPLETVAVLVIAALLMRIERPASEQVSQHVENEGVEHKAATPLTLSVPPPAGFEIKKDIVAAPALTENERWSTDNRFSISSAPKESSLPLTPQAPAPDTLSASSVGLSPQEPVEVVVVHAKNINDVQNLAQRMAVSMKGRVILSSNREPAAQTISVELPQEKVAAFKTQLLQSTESPQTTDTLGLATPRALQFSRKTTGSSPHLPDDKAVTNMVGIGGTTHLGKTTERKTATVVLEIQVVPPKD